MQEPRLTKEQFVDRFEEQIREHFPDCEIGRKDIQKPRSVQTSLVIRKPGCEAAPSIRLDDYWSAYQEAEDYEAEEKRLLTRLQDSLENGFAAAENGRIADVAKEAMENWRSNVQCILMMKDGNEAYLQDKPTMDYLDMVKVYFINIADPIDGHIGKITITNDHFEALGCTLEELDEIAMENTRLANSPDVRNIASVLGEILGEPEEAFMTVPGEVEFPMYVVTNQSKHAGATLIMFPDVQEKICQVLKSDGFYMLPSSIHETLCLPLDIGKDVDALRRMVHEVNMTQVPPEDLLSENVYYYERGQGLRICVAEPTIDEEPEEAFTPVL